MSDQKYYFEAKVRHDALAENPLEWGCGEAYGVTCNMLHMRNGKYFNRELPEDWRVCVNVRFGGYIGHVHCTNAQFIAGGWTSVEACETYLRGVADTYNDWANGNVWGYTINKVTPCKCCANATSEEIDSCWGFYGDDLAGMLENAAPEHHDALRKAWENRR